MAHLPQPVDSLGPAYATLVPVPPGPLPATPVEYHQLLRGPRLRWWRPLLSLLLVIGIGGALLLGVFAVGGTLELAGVRGLGSFDDDLSPLTMLAADLSLAALIPAAGLATWIAHRIRPRFVSSVVGGIRWRWLGRCVLVTLPVWAAYMALGLVVDPPVSGRPTQWVLLLVMAVVLTPFQAAGEEYLFRGWLVQNVGSLFRRRVVGLVVSTVSSAVLFSLAHGSLDFWVILNISVLAVAACLANWRTGGLEAGIAMHLVNNVSVGVVTITVGGYADSFVDTGTTGSPVEVGMALVVNAIAVALILWQGRCSQVQWRFQPPLPAIGGPSAYVLANDRPTWNAPLG